MTSDEQTLIQLQNDWMEAWRDANNGRLEEILAPEFTLTSARTDQIVNRTEWLRMLPNVHNESFAYSDFRIDVFGDAAVVRSRLTQVATVGEQRWDGTFVLTDVWIRRAGQWQVVARHSSTPPAKGFAD
jgi:hypothetical protein